MNWIENEYRFPKIDPEAASYFEEADPDAAVREYSFSTIPQLRRLIEEHMHGVMTDREILEAAKETFRNRPKADKPDSGNAADRQPVDFQYQMM